MRRIGTLAVLCLSLGTAHAATVTRATVTGLVYNNVVVDSNQQAWGTITVTFDAVAQAAGYAGSGSASVITVHARATKTTAIGLVSFEVVQKGTTVERTIRAQGFGQDGSCYRFIIEDHQTYSRIVMAISSAQSACSDGPDLTALGYKQINYTTVG